MSPEDLEALTREALSQIVPGYQPDAADPPAGGRGGLDQTFKALAAYEDREVVIPVLGSALEEMILQENALALLATAPESRAPREIVRRFHHLDPDRQDAVLTGTSERILRAARQLLRSDRPTTRENVAHIAARYLTLNPDALEQVLPILLVLFDDPREEVAEPARRCFLDSILRSRLPEGRELGAHDPVLKGLALLFARYPTIRDRNVIRALLAVGVHGSDLLGRALGQVAPETELVRQDIVQVAAEQVDSDVVTSRRADGVFRWLDSPFRPTREAARGVLKSRTDARFLRASVRRLQALDGGQQRELPVYRHMRWEELPRGDLAELPEETLLRIAGYLASGADAPAVSASRLARLLPATAGRTRLEVLGMLRELPTDSVGAELAPLLTDPDVKVQVLATELVPVSGAGQGYGLLIQQLASRYDAVRELAQRRLSGKSLGLYLEAFDGLPAAERRRLLPILRKIDLTFMAQLRRALRSHDSGTVIRALKTVRELSDPQEVEEGLFDLTVSPDPHVRATLARTLNDVDPEPRLHYLRLFLSDDDERVVANAAETLGELGDERAIPWLRELEEHPHHRVRVNALWALATQGEGDARARLEALDQSEGAGAELRQSVAWAMARLREGPPATGNAAATAEGEAT